MSDKPEFKIVEAAAYLRFKLAEGGTARTHRVEIYPKFKTDDVGALGVLAWYGPWHQYALFPADGTVFNRACLASIDEQLQELNNAQRRKSSKYD